MKVSSSETSSSLVTPKIMRINQGQILFWLLLSAAAFAMSCQHLPQESTTAAQRLAEGTTEGGSSSFLPSHLSPPCFYFLTASSLGSHSPHHVCTGQADDCHIESNQEMLLTYLFLLQSLSQTHCSKKPKLFPSNMTTGYKTISAD